MRVGSPNRQPLVAALRQALPPDRVAATPEELLVHGYDGTWLDHPPAAVALPRSVGEVVAALGVARRLGAPVVPRGAGTGLAGGSIPVRESLVISLTLMDRILDVDVAGRVATVEPGVVNARLQAEVERRGLFYPPDPASLKQSTIGGNVATAASGPRCLKYGGTREYVVGLEVVTAAGKVLRLGGRGAREGLDAGLLHLFVGSEGTLGIVTEVSLRLLRKPPARGTLLASFPHLDDASRAVGGVLGAGVVPLALEMMDRATLRAVEAYLHLGLPLDVDAVLLLDVDGDAAEVDRQLAEAEGRFRESGATVERATTPAEADRLWQARRATSASFGRLRPNKLGEDISVPRSAIPAVVRSIQELAARHDLLIPLFGHIGDGNVHPNILCDLRNRAEMARVARAAEGIFAVALAHGGTLSGEHGIGLLKRGFLPGALTGGSLEAMREIRQVLDPEGTLNPGKVL